MTDTMHASDKQEQQKKKQKEPSADQVEAYLKRHPEFFKDRDGLLASLKVPHKTGGAISLLERQLEIHRERNVELRQRLTRLIDNARRNDILFEKTKRLVLQILASQNLEELQSVIEDGLVRDFDIDYANLQIFSTPEVHDAINLKLLSDKDLQQRIKRIFKGKQALCGEFTEEELVMLFPSHHQNIASGASVFLRSGRPLGTLSVGSDNEDKFKNSMDTLFLNFIGEVLSQTLPKFL